MHHPRSHVLDTVGGTPLVRLQRLPPAHAAEVWIKLEGGNPTGSYKDRVAVAMIEGLESSGALVPGTRLLECTGGSTGTALAFVCAAMRLPLTIISSDAYAREKLASMRAFGATLIIEPSLDGAITPDLWPRMRAHARRLVARGGYLWLDQFNNTHAPAGYHAMGTEILEQAPGPIDAFCGMVGTAGMITGVGGALREARPHTRIVALEPASSAVISGGLPGAHGVDGTGAGFVPPLFDRRVVTEVRAIDEAAGRAMCLRLACEEGIFAGTSTGLNVVAALELAAEIGPGGRVVTVACDTGFKYLAGPLFDAASPITR